jgi:hypothetical protein
MGQPVGGLGPLKKVAEKFCRKPFTVIFALPINEKAILVGRRKGKWGKNNGSLAQLV